MPPRGSPPSPPAPVDPPSPKGRRGAEPRPGGSRGRSAARPVPPRRAGCGRWLLRLGLVGAGVTAALALVGAGVGSYAYRTWVVDNPGPQFDRANVRAVIAQESPVFYRDGVTPVGVFFEGEHRVYVPYEGLPAAWVMSIVAAEDAGFWTHPGVSAPGIARAVRDNVLAGRVVAGGSSLTQQTAKNLFYRPDRSLRAKGMELVNALRLEAHFSKSEILTFYANQFHVTGNGRGIGIGARHFFDAEPEDLGLVASAFLAGLVKAPAYYDPFLGDAAQREAAIAKATDRTRYVLGRIVATDAEALAGPRPIPGDAASARAFTDRVAAARATQAEARRLLGQGFEIPFKRGTFRFESSAVLDEVARRLQQPPFRDLLGARGADPTSGLVVITTLDVDAEREATYGLWHHLTEVGTWLEDPGPDAFLRSDVKAPRFDPDFPPRVHEFRFAAVSGVAGSAGKVSLTVDLGGHACVVDREALVRAAAAIHRGKARSASAKVPAAEVDALAGRLPPGAVVWVSVRSVIDGTARCDLERRPELQGSVVVLDHGQVRAMVAGNDNRNFNRATALRQFGSTWKPLIYHAALQLGWSPADVLDNRRNLFTFSGTAYWPSPDHAPAESVSMSWAGVNSENLASVWLLYHLTDRLDSEEVRRLAASLDLAQRADEAAPAYEARIQRLGVLPTPARVVESVFLRARHEVLAQLETAEHPEDDAALRSLTYGWGFEDQRDAVAGDPAKRAALDNQWATTASRVAACDAQRAALERALEDGRTPAVGEFPDLLGLPGSDPLELACGSAPEPFVPLGPWAAEAAVPATPAPAPGPAPAPAPERGWWRRDRPTPAPGDAPDGLRPPRISGPRLAPRSEMRLDGRLHLSTIDALATAMERQRQVWEVAGQPSLYDPEVLHWNPEFRVLLSLRYVAALAEAYGVVSPIQQVLSLPLGASEITLEEATALYGGLVSGTTWTLDGVAAGQGRVAAPADPGLLIAEIRDVDGQVLYRARPEPKQVAPPESGAMTADILRNVVRWGTGRRAAEGITAAGNPIPVGGKTGTTNDYKNAAFVGFAPVATADGYDPAQGLAVGVYVGYDDNRPLVAGGIRLAGASGALPAWITTVQGLEAAGLLGRDLPVGATEGGAWPLRAVPGLVRVASDPVTGVPTPDAAVEPTAPSLLVAAPVAAQVDFAGWERPDRQAPGTDLALPPEQRRRRPRRDPWSEPTTPEAAEPER
jgi:penicillin-binding protein 1A